MSKQQFQWVQVIHSTIDAKRYILLAPMLECACARVLKNLHVNRTSRLQLNSTDNNNTTPSATALNHKMFGPRRKREVRAGKKQSPQTNRRKEETKVWSKLRSGFLRNGSGANWYSVIVAIAIAFCCCYVCARCTCVRRFHQHSLNTVSLLIELNECEKA